MSDATTWLTQSGFGQYAAIFAENDIDEDVLPDLTDEDLKGLGISLGHRKKLLRAIAALQQGAGASVGGAVETRRSPSAGAPLATEAERRQLTVMFCDLEGFTSLSEKLGILRKVKALKRRQNILNWPPKRPIWRHLRMRRLIMPKIEFFTLSYSKA